MQNSLANWLHKNTRLPSENPAIHFLTTVSLMLSRKGLNETGLRELLIACSRKREHGTDIVGADIVGIDRRETECANRNERCTQNN